MKSKTKKGTIIIMWLLGLFFIVGFVLGTLLASHPNPVGTLSLLFGFCFGALIALADKFEKRKKK